MAKTILIADNHPKFLETRRIFLESAGYRVLTATSPEEARYALKNEWVHLALLDIRLADNNDRKDDSGLQIAKDPAFRHIPKIMLTAYPNYESVRIAMGPAAVGLPPAVDYLGKIEGPQAMLDAVDSALAKHLRLNWDLQIHWTDQWPAELAGFVALLSSQTSPAPQAQFIQEAEDLLRRLFLDFTEISIGRILWRRLGRAAVIVFAFNEHGKEQQFLVTSGAVAAIATERMRADECARLLDSPSILRRTDHAETLHLGANCYEVAGHHLDSAKSLLDYIRQNGPRESVAAVERVIQNFWLQDRSTHLAPVETSLATLFANRLSLEATFSAECARKIERLGDEVAKVGIATIRLSAQHLMLQSPRGLQYTFVNPLPLLQEQQDLQGNAPIVCGPSWGYLGLDSILVNSDKQPWFTDFGSFTNGPIVADFAALETSIKLGIVDDVTTLDDLHELEREFLGVERLSQRLEPSMSQFSKVVSLVQKIRQMASSQYGDAVIVYKWALAFHAVKRLCNFEPGLRRPRRDTLALLHACLCLGLLANNLAHDSPAPVTSDDDALGLWIDEANRDVRLNGRSIAVSPLEYNALLCLWQNAGQLRTREEMMAAIYGQEYRRGKVNSDDAQLNMLISRVRSKIEVDPEHPRFLVTRRGVGFILYPQPH